MTRSSPRPSLSRRRARIETARRCSSRRARRRNNCAQLKQIRTPRDSLPRVLPFIIAGMTPLDVSQQLVLDLRGIRCPHVVLRAKKALRDVSIGGTLVLECTDPLTVIDVPHFVTQTGHALRAQERDGDIY